MIKLSLSEAVDCMDGKFYGKDRNFYGISIDSREVNRDELFFSLRGPNFNGNKFSEHALMKNAAASVIDDKNFQTNKTILVENTQIALGKLAKAWRQKVTAKIIAITGSNGKTSVKEILNNCISISAKVLSTDGNLNNHIGLPMMLLRLDESYEYSILEMGANHPKEIDYLVNLTDPFIVVINNAGPAHLEGFTDIKGVAKAKGEILQGKLPPKYACLNYDDKYYDLWCEMAKYSSVISFGFNPKASVFAKDIEVNLADHISSFTLVLPDSSTNIELPVVGKHNIMNACAAAAVMYSLSMPIKSIKQGLEIPLTVPGRLNFLKGIGNHCVIDDSYNANPTSTNAAIDLLSTMKDYKCLVMGDMKELGKDAIEMHSLIGLKAKESGVDRFLGIGDMMKYSVKEFGDNGYWFNTVDQLLCHLHKLIEDAPKMNILVKGSRSMRMDKIIKEII
ncbi:UDP-N-acetylmuramoyl-tripeptide--D-alanyl-D-alanine ligase [Woeseiaceae bacterium]|nr:UDP-N-acetylmuramoyl-tripeptide--D-alanyl-D-alanine ligase [Woeseiaceae bacterium]